MLGAPKKDAGQKETQRKLPSSKQDRSRASAPTFLLPQETRAFCCWGKDSEAYNHSPSLPEHRWVRKKNVPLRLRCKNFLGLYSERAHRRERGRAVEKTPVPGPGPVGAPRLRLDMTTENASATAVRRDPLQDAHAKQNPDARGAADTEKNQALRRSWWSLMATTATGRSKLSSSPDEIGCPHSHRQAQQKGRTRFRA